MLCHAGDEQNFGMVEEDLYRSGQPNELNFPFLEKLGLKTVIYLAPEEPNQRFLNFIDDQDINLRHMGANASANAWDPISEDVVLEALDCILDPRSYPIAIMCNLGRHRTGTVVGCLRKLQRWNLTSIFEEYRRYAGPKVRVLNEQFIELFDCDLATAYVHSLPRSQSAQALPLEPLAASARAVRPSSTSSSFQPQPPQQANLSDRLVGGALVLFSIFVFTYYTVWALLLPFLEDSNPLQSFFPPRYLAIQLPVILLVVGLFVIVSFISLVMIRSGSKKKKT
ncbi:tyrosine-protein phosphatase required for protection against superoxide stress (By similarity) [Dinochytrium kinnereticum]|nr:tyrosine-protein phosphatase required for protection against superoxide stress (By similarity) [Dinochytrium kinnereticum]